MSKEFPFYTDEKTAKAIISVAKHHKSQKSNEQITYLPPATVTTQSQDTCQFKQITDWHKLADSNFAVSAEKFIPLPIGAEQRSYLTTIYAYGERPVSGKNSIIVATRRANQWVLLVTGAVSVTAAPPSDEPATVIEPLRRPHLRNIPPDPYADEDTFRGNAARCMGTIALPNKTYSPIQVGTDNLNNPIYLKRREPRTGSGRFVLRWNGVTYNPVMWIFADGADFPNTALAHEGTGDFLLFFLHPANIPYVIQNWVQAFPDTTTTDIALAQYNYDYAICYNLDWSELLIEGDKVEYQKRTTILEVDNNEITFEYYEVQPLQEFHTPVEGQAGIELQIVTPEWENPALTGDPIAWTMNEADSQHPEPPEPPDYEAVFLKLKNDNCTPELVKSIGICNDCTSLRVRGVFIREDIKGRRYPMLFELPTLWAGGAIRAREVSCYYKTEHDECSPVGVQPEMTLIRMNDWRLADVLPIVLRKLLWCPERYFSQAVLERLYRLPNR